MGLEKIKFEMRSMRIGIVVAVVDLIWITLVISMTHLRPPNLLFMKSFGGHSNIHLKRDIFYIGFGGQAHIKQYPDEKILIGIFVLER